MYAEPGNTYKCFYKKFRPIEITTATTSYEAQCRAAEVWNLKPSQRKDVTVVLCEKNGEQVTHVADF